MILPLNAGGHGPWNPVRYWVSVSFVARHDQQLLLCASGALWEHGRISGCLWQQVFIDEWSGGHVDA